MSDREILLGVRECVANVLGIDAGQVEEGQSIVEDLGADSLDLLDLVFQLERRFGISISPRGIEQRAKDALGGAPLEIDGVYTPEALVELRRALPEVPPEELAEGLTTAQLPRRFRVATMAGLVRRLLAEKEAREAAGVPGAD